MALLPFDGDKPVVQMMVDGRALRMQLDTGAETSVLTMQGAARLGLAAAASRRQVQGLGGTALYGTVRLSDVAFGGQTVRGLDVPVMQLRGATGLDGLIGTDLLSPYQVLLDFPSRRVTLYHASGCADPRPPFAAEALGWRTARRLPVVAARLDGRDITALLDTGSNHSAVGDTPAGLVAADLSKDRAVRGYGAGGMAVSGRVHRFATLSLGDRSIPRPALRVMALDPMLGIGAVIGMDLLGGHRLWLDYAGRRCFIDAT